MATRQSPGYVIETYGMDPHQLLQMLQGGGNGMPQAQNAQAAAPSAAQPGGGPQMVQGMTPEQQQLLSDFNLLIMHAKKVCSQILALGKEREANACDGYINKITKLKVDLQEDFMDDAVQSQINNAVMPQARPSQM